MTPQRIAVKFFALGDTPVELEPFIGLFHRFIQEGVLEGLLLDVADYSHVPEGPGVLLVGHDVDYGLDEQGGRTGLLTVRKRFGDLPLADVLRDALRRALGAVRAIEDAGSAGLRFDTGTVEVQLVDRLTAPNSAESWEAARKEVEAVAAPLFGDAAITRAHEGDARQTLAFGVRATKAASAAELLTRLGPGTARAATVQPEPASGARWDISVEDLKALRDEGSDFVLVDVREQREFEICNLGGELIPLGSLPGRLGELDRAAHIVVHCRTGARSGKAVELMRAAGFGNAWNVGGGILAWIDRIDPSLTPY
jgi:adenylyltransferase/sulfurtransferase